MDHISGFDGFFRLVYDRNTKENHIWGPAKTSQIIQHRFQGFLWNIYQDLKNQWYVHDIHSKQVETTCFAANEAFAIAHPINAKAFTNILIDTPEYSVEAYSMNHQTPSIAYIVREKPSVNVDTTKLTTLGLKGGSWLKDVKNPEIAADISIEINGQIFLLGDLREKLLVKTEGESLAYLTDFLLDESAQDLLSFALKNCSYMICESQYRATDKDLALKNYHMMANQVAELAKKAQVEELILFHVSDRYDKAGWEELLAEAQAIFPNTHFPNHWF